MSLKIIFSMLFPLFCNLRYVFRLMMNFFPMTGYGYIDFDICYKKFLFVCLFIYKACNKQIGKEELTCVRPIYASSLSQQHTHPSSPTSRSNPISFLCFCYICLNGTFKIIEQCFIMYIISFYSSKY